MASKLYVGNLSYDTTESSLRTLFEGDGRRVEEVALIMDRDTGRPRGFAFVSMGSAEDSRTAIEALNGREVEGRTLTVSEAKPRTAGAGGPPRNFAASDSR
jgi:cold-inducible RNA-binding protein